jgi:hypothetical protein
MTLGLRKIILLGLIGMIFLMGNIVLIANWLSETGLPEFADHIRSNYLTGTAITIIVALLILLTGSKTRDKVFSLSRRCPVCDKRLMGNPNYCPDCGNSFSG